MTPRVDSSQAVPIDHAKGALVHRVTTWKSRGWSAPLASLIMNVIGSGGPPPMQPGNHIDATTLAQSPRVRRTCFAIMPPNFPKEPPPLYDFFPCDGGTTIARRAATCRARATQPPAFGTVPLVRGRVQLLCSFAVPQPPTTPSIRATLQRRQLVYTRLSLE
jgi:hypothetical protein